MTQYTPFQMDREQLLSMPKVELHVLLEGSIRPETLLKLALRNQVMLPANTEEGLRDWYRFTDFEHFVEIYTTLSGCIKQPEDIELIATEFLASQAEQNIIYTEATFTAFTLYQQSGIPWNEQIDAINRARAASAVEMQLIVDIVREKTVEEGETTAQWVLDSFGNGVCALGLSGIEKLTEPKKHRHAFEVVRQAGIPCSCHAGETAGPWSILACLDDLNADRIGHGITCLQDDELVSRLRESQIPIEVCPSSNVCLGVASSLDKHPVKPMLGAGLNVTINSDDPPMFNTTLTNEYFRCAQAFGLVEADFRSMTSRAIEAAFMTSEAKEGLRLRVLS